MFLGSKVWLMRGLTTLPPSMYRLSRQCGILNFPQPYRPHSILLTCPYCGRAYVNNRHFRKWDILICGHYSYVCNVRVCISVVISA
jgi:hypothetical protein